MTLRSRGMLIVLGAAFLIRAIPILSADFPLNDGALFLAMTRALEANHWIPPQAIVWNGVDVPYAYPPLGFYFAGLLHVVSGMDLLDVLRFVPLAFTTLAAGMVYLVGLRLIGSPAGALAAGLTYAFAPGAFLWPIYGGGITRAPGILLALLAIWLFLRLIDRPTVRNGAALGLTAGLTALTHPGAMAFTAISCGILLVARWNALWSHPRRSLMSLATAAVIAAVIVAPWLVVTVGRHGMGVILDVPSNGPHLLTVLTSMLGARSTGSDLVDPLAAVMLAMAILHLVRRRWLLPALWLATSILSIQYGIVFGSMLVGSLAAELWTVATSWLPSSRRVGQAGVVVITLLLVIEGALGVTATQRHGSHLAPISADRREAMGWVADHLPSGATVAVLTGGVWSTDADSEWFYVLAERTSSATVQGSEWLGEGAFDRHQIRYQTLQRCAELDDGCVSAWLERWPAGYLFIPRGRLDGPASPPDCCEAARYALRNSGEFEVIYDDAGATIFRTRYPADARSSA